MALKTFTEATLTSTDINTFSSKGDTYIAQANVSAGSIINCFSSVYQNYKIVVNNLNGSVDAYWWFQLGYAGGTNWLGGLYYQGGAYQAYTTGALTVWTNNNTVPYFQTCAVSVPFTNTAVINLGRPFTSSPTEYSCHTTLHHSVGVYSWHHGGKQNSTQSCDSIRWAVTSGTMTSGTVTVYGVQQP
jgi:hypothetical protein